MPKAVASAGAPPRPSAGSLKRAVLSYLLLTKPNIIVLLLVTTLAGMLAADRGGLSAGLAVATLAAGYLCAGGASALNSYLDRDIDPLMERTRKRPLPSRRVSEQGALVFGVACGAVSIALFAVFANGLSAVLAAFAFLYYVFGYTWYLKRRTPQNIVIGGAAGAFPPTIGWVAVTGSLEPAAVFLFLAIFFWTPPHAWALALMVKDEYRKARVPMLPVVMGEHETTWQMLLYSVSLLAVTVLPVAFGLFGPLYFAGSLVLGVAFLVLAARVHRNPTPALTRRLYKFSTTYLALYFLVLVLDRVFFTT
ncbi:MAG: protoheme IX farnesyltransferase [Dehalococcoidia bacterium]|nr:protoheme IX farnesyltransferase [Dehalococcoidia bacterium]